MCCQIPTVIPDVLAPFGQAFPPLIALVAALVPWCEGELKGKRKTENSDFCLYNPILAEMRQCPCL